MSVEAPPPLLLSLADLTDEERAIIQSLPPGPIVYEPHPLEAQMEEALAIIDAQIEIIGAAHELMKVISAQAQSGDPVFTTTCDDPIAVATLNHRYADLAALLNNLGRPVPSKLDVGTVH